MDLAESLAKGIITYFHNRGVKENARLEKYDPPLIFIQGVDFTLNLNGRKLDVLIVPTHEDERFSQYFEEISTGEIFTTPGFEDIRDGMNKSQYHLRNKRFYRNGNGGYHFRCQLAAQSEEKIIFGLLSYVIRPVLMHKRVLK